MPLTDSADPFRPRIRAAVLGGYPELAERLGLDPLAELARAGITPEQLAQPDEKLPVEQINGLLERSAFACAKPDFAVRLAASVNVMRLGLLRFLAHDQPTVGQAFEMVSRHMRFHNEALSLWAERSGEVRVIHLDLVARALQPMPAMVELATGVTYFNVRAISGPIWNAHRVLFRHPAPAGGEHASLFACPVEFGCDVDAIVCRATDFDAPNRLFEPDGGDRRAQLRAAGLMPESRHIVDMVQRLICGLLPTGNCRIEVVAGHLSMTSRTLHRKLAAHGETFSNLLNSVRRDFALRHLVASNRQLTAIADLLGFKSLSDFSNWFRRQFGMSPTQWAKSAGRSLSDSRPD